MNLLERITKRETTSTPEPSTLSEVRETLAAAPSRPFPSGTNEPTWIRHQRELREAAGGRLVATKEL